MTTPMTTTTTGEQLQAVVTSQEPSTDGHAGGPAPDVVAKEREIAEATAREEGKPEQALPKIVEGRVNGFFKENVLVEQAFAKDAKKTVGKVLEEAGARVTGFARFRVGQA